MAKDNFVAPLRKRVEMPVMPTSSEVVHTINATPHATQHVEMRTSAVDRAKGHLISMVPLYAMVSTATVAVCVLGFGLPWLAMPTLVIFVVVFAASWLVSWLYQLRISPEGVNYMEADRKWGIIEKEHDRRWSQWERMTGGDDDE
jgi:hypothetical protein